MECLILYCSTDGSLRELEELIRRRGNISASYREMSRIPDSREFFRLLPENLAIIISGSDRSLNEFINRTRGIKLKNPIYYYPSGESLDFFMGLEAEQIPDGQEPERLRINEFLQELPVVSIKGRDFLFINGISCGIGGEAGEIRRRLRDKTGRCVNFRSPGLRRELLKFKPRGVSVSVDGMCRHFKRAWIASVLNGRYLSGNCPVPGRSRCGDKGRLSVIIFHNCSRLGSLLLCPFIFKGEYRGMRRYVTVLSGDDISLRFDGEVGLRIDGRSLRGVDYYRVRSGRMIKKATPAFKCIPENLAETI